MRNAKRHGSLWLPPAYRPVGMQQQQAALTASRIILTNPGTIKKTTYSLLANQAVYDGGAAYFDTSAYGTVTGTPSTTTIWIGWFLAPPASSASNQNVDVELVEEISIAYWDSVTGGNAVTAANMFQPLYWSDNHTLTTASASAQIAGRLVAFAPVGYQLGCGICRYSANCLI
jgi:hypothetical protein